MLQFPSSLPTIILSYCLTLLILPILITFWCFCFIFKQIIRTHLHLKLGSKFAGILGGLDSLWIDFKKAEVVADILFMINITPDQPINIREELIKLVDKTILEQSDNSPKFSSTVHSCCGYPYLFKINIDYNQVIKVIEVNEDSELYNKSLMDILTEISNKNLPYENKFLWQLVTVIAPDEWKLKNNLKKNQVPLVVRMNHIFADGLALARMFTDIHTDEKYDFRKIIRNITKNIATEQGFCAKVLQMIHIILLVPGYILCSSFQKEKSNIKYMEPPKVKGNKVISQIIDKDGHLLKSIKTIKKTLGDVTFVEVLLTAASASLRRYLILNRKEVPDASVTLLPVNIDIEDLLNDQHQFRNSFAFFYISLPVALRSTSLLQRLNELTRETREKTSHHFRFARVINFYLSYIVGVLPGKLKTYLLTKHTTSISNIPGCPKLHVFNGHEVENVLFFPTIRDKQLGFSVLTYNNRLHLGLVADSNFIPNYEEGQKIVEDFFQNIRLLEQEVITNSKSTGN